MFPPLSILRRRLIDKTPKLIAPPFLRSLSTTTAPAARSAVAVLWDLAASRPPSTLTLYDAAVRLHLATTCFGHFHLSAAFLHPSHRLPVPAAVTTHLCRVCGRRFRERDALLCHLEAIQTHEYAKRLARIDSVRGGRRVRLAAELSLKLSTYEKAARELAAAADELCRASVRAELSRTPAASLRERAQQVLDEGSVGCLMLVSAYPGARSLPPLASGGEGEARAFGGGWRRVRSGEVGPWPMWGSVGRTWSRGRPGRRRRPCPGSGETGTYSRAKGLEWRYEGDDDEEVVVFEDSDDDGVDELARRAKGRPWWKLDDSDGEDSSVGC